MDLYTVPSLAGQVLSEYNFSFFFHVYITLELIDTDLMNLLYSLNLM